MRRIILIVAALALAVVANVWEPGGDYPTYRVRPSYDGSYNVYNYGDPFSWQYKIKADGRIYKASDPTLPVGHIRDGLPDNKRGK